MYCTIQKLTQSMYLLRVLTGHSKFTTQLKNNVNYQSNQVITSKVDNLKCKRKMSGKLICMNKANSLLHIHTFSGILFSYL